MRYVRKNINAFLDGKGYAGRIEDFNPPKLATVNEEFRAGGMNAPMEIVMGMEKLESNFALVSYDPDAIAAWGVSQGNNVQFTVREALESADGEVTAVIHNMHGRVKEVDQGTAKPGERSTIRITLALSYYKLTHGARMLHEIDVPNMTHVSNGIDVLAPVRAALGI